MTRIRSIALAAVLALFAVPSLAAARTPQGFMGRGSPELVRDLFSPRLVMRHQAAIGLSETQRAAITKAMVETRTRLVDVQWRLARESAALEKLVAGPRIDRAAALAQAKRVMAIEEEMKTAHLGLLIEIKNQLEPGQQARLRMLRDREGRRDGRRERRKGRRGRGAFPPADDGTAYDREPGRAAR
jgi:Spy/CpxP family protein refolding chaperone